MMLRIKVDFNTMNTDDKERVYINTYIHKELVELLHPSLLVVLYDEEMEVEAILEFDEQHQEWLGQPNWSTRHDLPYP